ncbi:hypothetical protein jhhlp_004190 [Lomentospora prolificans]|uniref:Uncharacterized protein n=1 Tax=Lomentospora prolificans TaxID=41688 RepID=A0A2N3NAV9_9PEZI|nr:hypothetical protein jhhlp_004190 [Lomentospora prolificans]
MTDKCIQGCTEWTANRVFLCGHPQDLRVETFKTYCSTAESSLDKSCGSQPKQAAVGSKRLKEPCGECKGARKWRVYDGIWAQL